MIKVSILAAILHVLITSGSVFAQWRQLEGPYGGYCSEIASIGGELFVAAAEDGVYYSSNDGLSWQLRYLPGNRLSVWSIQGLGSRLIATLSDGFGSALIVSDDGGKNWSGSESGLDDGGTYSLQSDGHILILTTSTDVFGSPHGFYYSVDSASSWQRLKPPQQSTRRILPTLNGLYAITDSALFRSTDFGVGWTLIHSDPTLHLLDFIGNIGFASTDSNVLERSTDLGMHWSPSNTGLPTLALSNLTGTLEHVYLCAGKQVYSSSDSGISWSYAGHTGVSNLNAANGLIFASAGNEGIMRSVIGSMKWQAVGINCKRVDHLCMVDSTLFASSRTGYGGSIDASFDAGQTWRSIDYAFDQSLDYPLTVLQHAGRYVFAANVYTFRRSSDTGRTWPELASGVYYGYIVEHNGVFFVDSTSLYYGTEYDAFYTSTDWGSSWSERDTDIHSSDDNENIFALTKSGNNLIAATSDKGIVISQDEGRHWSRSSIGMDSQTIYTLTCNDRYVFAGTYRGGVFRSSDHGYTWKQVSHGVENVKGIDHFVSVGSDLFASAHDFSASHESGVFYSNDDGDTWADVSQGLINNNILELTIKDSTLFVGTDGSGIWKRPLAEMIVPKKQRVQIEPYSELTVSPNPSSGQITLYGLPDNTEHVEVLNMMGVNMLDTQPSTTLDVSVLPAGLYVVRVVTRSRSLVRSFVKE
jgi:photosystem II stability/assembly factor-like uncharacterized protein